MLTYFRQFRRISLPIFAIIGIAGAVWFMRSFSAVTPEQVMSSLFDVSAPTRYAFVSDKNKASVAVVDLLEHRQVSTLTLQAPPYFWALSATQGKLFYSAYDDTVVHIHDVANHNEQQLNLPHRIQAWQYSDAHHWLFVWGDGFVSRVDIISNDIETVDAGVAVLDGMLYDAFLQKLWLIDGEHNQLTAWALTEAEQNPTLYHYPLSVGAHDFAPLTSTPDGLYLLIGFADENNQYQLKLWDMTIAAWVEKPFLLHQSPLVRPYAGARGRYLWVFAQDGQGLRIDVASPHLTEVVKTSVAGVKHIATGWLDQRLLVAGESNAEIYEAGSLNRVAQIALPSTVQEVFITADSKTALLTVDGTPFLYAIELKGGGFSELELGGIANPDKVIMGASATLCH
ncbi:hypothetical protein KRX19_11085 [Cardiobacteriaceae bacterium TAE3-ERU3]|nr:hypothetical protein [Cardiobacteriaceae bacterium TAE3-ERU3]